MTFSSMPNEGWGCDDDVMTVTEDSVCAQSFYAVRMGWSTVIIVKGCIGAPHGSQRQSSEKCLGVLAHSDFLFNAE